MMSWKRFARGNCPVCNGTRSDCRQNRFTGLIHCRDTDANPIDYIFRGTDRQGFAMWAYKPDAEAWNDERREEWQRQRQLEKERRRSQYAKSLSEPERDRIIRAILSQLRLTDAHLETLRHRGLSDAEIAAGQFRSVGKWQPLDFPVNDRLAGVKLGGNSLLTPDSGILCPIPNHRGELVSWQLRRDNPDGRGKRATRSGVGGRVSGVVEKMASSGASNPDQGKRPIEGGASNPMVVGAGCFPTPHTPHPTPAPTGQGKYIWASGDKQIQPKPSSHLPNGELPIACFVHSALTGIVGLTEGTHIKPYIASLRLGIAVLGAAGGNFASSPATLKASLEATSASIVRLYADAGSVLNPQVLLQYQKTFSLLHSWGYLVEVGWWGQVKKASGDIDEISPETFASIRYLTPEEFLALAQKEHYSAKSEKAWRTAKSYRSQIQIDKPYFEAGLPSSGTLTFIKSGLGTGKTTQLIEWLQNLADYGAIALGYRNSLLLQFCSLANFYHLHQDSASVYLEDPSLRVALCVDSILKLEPERFDGKILILDEVCSFIKHLLFSPTIRKRREVIERFGEAVRRADRVICLDGNMADWAVKFLQDICRQKQIVTIENIWSGNKPELHLLEGTIALKGSLRKNDKSPWLDALLNRSQVSAVASDSQVFLEALDDLLSKMGWDVFRIDSKTLDTPQVKEFLANPTAYLQKHKPQKLLYSPTAESGLDVPIKNYFTEHFAFFFGVLDVDAILQMLGRIRDVGVPKYLWVRDMAIEGEGIGSKSPFVETLEYYYRACLTKDLNAVLSGEMGGTEVIANVLTLVEQSKGADFDCALQLEAIRNHEAANYRACVRYALNRSGYSLVAHFPALDPMLDEVKQSVKGATDAVKEQNSQDIFNASDRLVGKEWVSLPFDASWLRRCELTKAKILARLPGIQDTEHWSKELIKLVRYDKPNLINQLERFYLITHLDAAKRLSRNKYLNLQQKFLLGEKIVPWRLRQEYSFVKTLAEIGLLDLVESSRENAVYTADSPAILAIMSKCQSRSVQQALKRKPGKDPMKFIGSLLRAIAVDWQAKVVKREGKPVRIYTLSLQWLNAPIRTAMLSAISTRYATALNESKIPEKNTFILGGAEEVQTQPGSGLDAVTLPPNNVYKPDGRSVTDFAAELIENKPPVLEQSEVVQTISGYGLESVTLPANNLDKPDGQSVTVPLLPTWEQVIGAIDAELSRLNWTVPSAISFLKGVYGKHSRHLLSDSQLLDFLAKLKQFMPTYGSQSPLSPGDVISHTVKGRGTIAWVSGDGRYAVVVWSNGQVSDPIYTYMMMPSSDADSA